MAQKQLRARGIVGGIGAPPRHPAYDEDEDGDLLRAVNSLVHDQRHADDSLDVERKRMHSRGGALHPMPVPALMQLGYLAPRPSSGFYPAKTRPYTSQSEGSFAMTVDESDDALQALQKLQLG